jgi:alkylation response protein AidB-like acyl-CoA dehydrogenase
VGMTTPPAPLVVARQIAEQVLFPAALATEAAEVVPVQHLDRLADAGLYGLVGPSEAGGLGADLATVLGVIEALAGGCLSSTFIWLQHHSTVAAVAGTAVPELRHRWLRPMCLGQVRAGIALAALRPGATGLIATRVDGGWTLRGDVPWVTGWGRIDVVHTAAVDDQGRIVWALVDAIAGSSLSVDILRLVAVQASATVVLHFDDHFVPESRVTGIEPRAAWAVRDAAGLRPNGSLALGVAGRCCALIGASDLDRELAASRRALDDATVESLPAARARAAELAARASATLVVSAGSRSILVDHHAQRLAREAMFLLVFGTRPTIRTALLQRLNGS